MKITPEQCDEDTLGRPCRVRIEECVGAEGKAPAIGRDGACDGCGQRVPVTDEVVEASEGHPGLNLEPFIYLRAEPHTRQVKAYAFEEPSECSCGGWWGTPVSLDAQTDGSELPLLQLQERIDDLDAKVERIIAILEANKAP